ncbi:MAG: hypothetical protein LBM74_09560 [Oscillospiraceae bacterium]|jgi:hypothetical protein|nr:hypothetical protein [Oscillospiraceae bacterium]
MIRPYDLFIVYISWGTGGKSRPVLVLSRGETSVDVFRITTKYANKSAAIKAKYYLIAQWREAGLDKVSYVDTGTLLTIPLAVIARKASIGQLTVYDRLGLLAWLNR